MRKFLFEAYDDHGRQVFSDESGMYWKEPLGIEVFEGMKFTMYRSVPHDDIEGTLGEPIDGEYEIYDENVICGFCEGFFEEGCEYVGDLGCNQSFACKDCIEDELKEEAERAGVPGFY